MTDVTGGAPHITVLMPAHNAGLYIGEAIHSIVAQTYRDFELLVIDDASTDETASVVRGFDDRRIIYHANERRLGIVETLNRGLDLARGTLISRHDADDVSEPQRLAVHVEMFEGDPGLVIAGNSLTLIDEHGSVIGVKGRPTADTAIRWRSLFLMPGIGQFTCRARVIRDHGVRFRIPGAAEDHGFWFDMLGLGRAENSPLALYRYRVHGTQASATSFERQNEESDKLASESFARLGLEVRVDDIRTLRAIYLEPPRARDPSSFSHFETMLAAADALARRPGIDVNEMRELRRTVLAKLLVAFRRDRRLLRALLMAARADLPWLIGTARFGARRGRRGRDASPGTA